MTREEKLQLIIEGMLGNPIYTPIHIWLQLLKKLDDAELDVLVQINNKGLDDDYTDSEIESIRSLVDRHCPWAREVQLFDNPDQTDWDDEEFIGLN